MCRRDSGRIHAESDPTRDIVVFSDLQELQDRSANENSDDARGDTENCSEV